MTRKSRKKPVKIPRRKILVADDDATIREIITTQMGRLNYEVITASNGQEAFQLFKSHKPNLVLMDVNMPKMDGLTACKAIRAFEKGRTRTPILFLTARSTNEDKLVSALSGGDDFVSKPISLEELKERVETALNKNK